MSKLSYLLISSIIIGVDRLLKHWATTFLTPSSPQPLLGQAIRLTRVHNTGGAFGIFPENGTLFLAISFTAALLITFMLSTARYRSRLINTGLSLVLAGAIGNLIDRLSMGYVLDFLEIRGLTVFNLADACISIGIALIIFYTLLGGKKNRSTR
ncbi:signal peptidase II [archaeon]|nr:MAG: signal peptidase II [archaeon]